jgi:RNA polymerase primary sigma factor
MYREAGIEEYFNDVNRYSLLSREEERDLIEKMRAGDAEARDTFIGSNLRLVVSIARRYVGLGLPLLDLIEEGNLGLIKAAKCFRLDVGCRFSTYATCWIRQSIRRALADKAKPVRIPSYLAPKLALWKRKAKKLAMEHNTVLTLRELAAELEIPAERYGVFHSAMSTSNSIQQTVSIDGTQEESIKAGLESKDQKLPEEQCLADEEIALILEFLDEMGERDATIIRMRFGMDGQEPMTLREIGEKVHLSRERVRQVKNGVLKQLNRRLTRANALC